MFYFRINQLKIKDNREAPRILGLFGRDLAEVKLVSFVTTGETELPDLDNLISTHDPEKRRAVLQSLVKQVVSRRILTMVENVKDNHVMTFGDTGYVLHQADQIPDDFNWSLIAIESDQDIRDVGTATEEVLADEGFDDFATQLLTVIGQATNPAYAAGIAIGKFATKVIAANLARNDDDMVGVLYMSLNRREHYPHGERKKNDVADLTNNMLIDYAIFGFE